MSVLLNVLPDDARTGLEAALEDSVLELSLSRPPVNAFSISMWERLRSLLTAVHDDETVRAILVTSTNPRVFSGGADFKELRGDVGEGYGMPGDYLRLAREALWSFYECPVPVIMAARGAAVGAGAVVLALADLVVGGPGTSLALPEVDRGVVGGSRHMARLVPEPLMRKMMLLGCTVAGAELERAGVFAEFVPDDEVVDTARRIALTLTEKHPTALRYTKQALIEVEAMDVRASYRVEQKYTVMMTRDVRPSLVPGPRPHA